MGDSLDMRPSLLVRIRDMQDHEAWTELMPHINGCSLQQRLDRDGPLELKEILRIGMQIAVSLAAAHAQGLVHRDIRPSNILLETNQKLAEARENAGRDRTEPDRQ
jgi:serine/threonine protein kinase